MAIRVLKLKKGTSYQANVRVDGRRLTRLFDRKGDAERWLRSQLDKRDLGELQIQNFPTLAEFSEEWLAFRTTRIAPCTMVNHRYLLKADVIPELGHLTLDRINPAMVQMVLQKMIVRGVSNRTANMALGIIQKLFNDAIESYGYRIKNPATKVPHLKENPRKLDFWSVDEVQRFLKAVNECQPWNLPIFRFLLNTGTRIGEAYALQWGDIDLEKGFVCIRRNVERVKHVAQESTKSNKIRYVGLNKGLLEMFRSMAKTHLTQPNSKSLVFPNQAGGLHHHSSFQRRCFQKCVEHAKVKKIRIHDMRHSFAAHFVMNGGSIYDLKQILGHSEITMTERYAHLAPEYLRSRTSLVDFQ